MLVTNEVIEYQGKNYARIEYAIGDLITPKSICRYFGSSNYNSYNMSCSEPTKCLQHDPDILIYIPVKIPEGYAVLKDNDEIGKDTWTIDELGMSKINPSVRGRYSEICKQNPQWRSYLMINPVKTPRQYFADALKSGVIGEWEAGREVESSKDGKNWNVSTTPNFSLPLQWRVKARPITPPVFDWRSTDDLGDSTVAVLVKWADLSETVSTAFKKNGRWYDCRTNALIGMSPTHYTVLE